MTLDHKLHVSYFGQQVHNDLSTVPYLVFSRRKIIPAYTQYEKRNGPKKPERLKLYPSKLAFDLYVSDRVRVWFTEITYESHNLTRKRPGGRDTTWPEDVFFKEIQTEIQNPQENPHLLFNFISSGDSGGITLYMKQKKDDIVKNFMKPCDLSVLNEDIAAEALALALEEERRMVDIVCRTGNLEKLKMYCEYGADVNPPGGGPWTPLQLATYCGHEYIVLFLVEEKGVDINVVSADGFDPIMCAIKGGHEEFLEYLLDKGAVLKDENDFEDGTEGHITFAAACGQRDIVKYLCRPGGPKDAQALAAHGKRDTNPPQRFFTTLDGYPCVKKAQEVPVTKKKRKKKAK
mmetsp:Transcript_23909/g.35093  ORF Transcript_23909/g.35093 Transcript_23909/m.35093 type:complete len:347 (+) Transcript_23909:125-1165(+)